MKTYLAEQNWDYEPSTPVYVGTSKRAALAALIACGNGGDSLTLDTWEKGERVKTEFLRGKELTPA